MIFNDDNFLSHDLHIIVENDTLCNTAVYISLIYK